MPCVYFSMAYPTVGGAWVKYFNLPIGDINSPSYNKFTEGIDFLASHTKPWQSAYLKNYNFQNPVCDS